MKKESLSLENGEIIFPEIIRMNYLKVINEIEFTKREIEVIACLLHGYDAKRVASFLSTQEKMIGNRVIETHISNIKRKINVNFKTGIIKFIENSDKFHVMRNYYSYLLIQKEFDNCLSEIRLPLKPSEYSITIVYPSAIENKYFIIEQLQEHLKRIISNVSVAIEQNFLNIFSESKTVLQNQYLICLAISDKNKICELISAEKINNYCIVTSEGTMANTFLSSKQKIKNLSHRYITLLEQNNYYFLFFKIIDTLLLNNSQNEIIVKFQERYNNILGSTSNNHFIGNSCEVELSSISRKTRNFVKKYKKYGYLFLILSVIVFIFSVNYNSKMKQREYLQQLAAGKLMLQNEIHQLLSRSYQSFSPRNLTLEEIERNSIVIKQFDKVIKLIVSDQIQEYVNIDVLETDILVNYIFNLNTTASYILFNLRDATKAEKVLSYAKNLTEKYLAHYNSRPICFDKLSFQEIYDMLSGINNLSEMYAITMYFLGRSTIYNNSNNIIESNIIQAEKYFELAKYLGAKSHLFENILSIINGLEVITSDKIDIKIKKGQKKQAELDLIESINIYKNIKEDDREFILNYKPSHKITTIIPTEDVHHIIDCNKRIIKLYTKLINITDDKPRLLNYLESVTYQIIGNENSLGILDILINSTIILDRIRADSYNQLGNLLIILYDKNINIKRLKDFIIKKLNLSLGNDLEIIIQIFELAKSLSPVSHFTKGEAYAGLANTYARKLSQLNSTDKEKNNLLLKIQNFTILRDKINQGLR